MKNINKKECKCDFCGNDNFVIPEDIINAIKNENLVIFAGAGISTEGKGVFPQSLYVEINNEMGENYDNSFPKLMTKYCNLPDGRRKLIKKIISRFDYYKSFEEVDNVMRRFYVPLSDIYGIKEIITTNWDRQFEEKCGCMPIVYDKDVTLIDEKSRVVYKIHGSIDNVGSLVITEEDYEKCYNSLKENPLGGRIKDLLSRKTVVFIGYSLEDEDFKKIWEFIDEKLGELKPHFYIVSPDTTLNEKLKNKNVTIINTLGATFIEKIRAILINEKYIFDSNILYSLASTYLYMALKIHKKTTNEYCKGKNILLMYSLVFQDGVIHAFERILSRKMYGEYLNPDYLFNYIELYDNLGKERQKNKNYFDSSYIRGYTYAMDIILYNYLVLKNKDKSKNLKMLSLYYLPPNIFKDKIWEFNKLIKKYNVKKYEKYAKNVLEELNGKNFEYVIHHLPFL